MSARGLPNLLETIPCAFPDCTNLGRMAFCHYHWQFATWSRADIYFAKTPEEKWTAIQMGIMQIALGVERMTGWRFVDEADRPFKPGGGSGSSTPKGPRLFKKKRRREEQECD